MKLILILILIILFSPVALYAEIDPASGWYVRFDAGISGAHDPELGITAGPLPADLGAAPVFGGGFGYALLAGARVDVTVSTRTGFEQISGFPDMPEGRADFRSTAILANVAFDFVSFERWSPFAGFGLGIARNTLDDIRITNPDGSFFGTIEGNSKTGFAWQLCAGIDVNLTNRLNLEMGYHYLGAGDYESEDLLIIPGGPPFSAKNTGSFGANEFQIGLRYTF